MASTATPPTADPRLAETLRLIEIYNSVQGESTWAGLPCVFVRLARCNLRCRWCDTTYSFHGGHTMTLAAIADQVEGFGPRLVEITGGEPLVQAACADLCGVLIDRGFQVLIETSGSLPIKGLPKAVIKIMDLKCPGSGESEKNHWPNIDALDPAQDEVKFVLSSRADYDWAREVIDLYHLTRRCRQILFSPVFGEIDPRDIVQWMLDDGLHEVRFQLQMHKFIWPPNERGV
jgi:7-carboxy-7-deazaguanine synthase